MNNNIVNGNGNGNGNGQSQSQSLAVDGGRSSARP